MSIARRNRRASRRQFEKAQPTLRELVIETERLIKECGDDKEMLEPAVDRYNKRWVKECEKRKMPLYINMYIAEVSRLNRKLKKGANGEEK